MSKNIKKVPEIKLYDCTTLCELKKKTWSIFFSFDPTQYGSKNILKRRVYWKDLFGIHDQTIMSWKNCLESSNRSLDLRYAFFLAIFIEANRQEARYFMAVAGHPAKDEPINYQGRDIYEVACFNIIDRVYDELEKTYAQLIEDDQNSNAMRKVRVELAREMAFKNPDLKKLWFNEEEK